MAACHSAAAQASNSGTPGGVQVYYTGSAVSSIPADVNFFGRVEAWVNDFASYCTIGKPNRIDYLGAYNYKLGLCKSEHEFGNAFDLEGLWFPNGKHCTNLNFNNDKKFTMGIEAGVRRKFRFTAGYLTAVDHHDHIHMDGLYTGPSFGGEGCHKFLKQSLNSVYGYSYAVDDTVDPAAVNVANTIAAYWGGATVPTNILTNSDHWKAYCRVTFIFGTA